MTQFLPALTSGLTVCASAVLKGPLVNYVGEWGCEVIINLNYAHILSETLGSTGMALFRLIIYRYTHRICRCTTIRNIILVTQLVASLGLFVYSWVVRSITKFSPRKDFCIGHDAELSETIQLYNGTPKDTLDFGKTLKNSRNFFLVIVMFTRLVCYMILYYWKHQDNRAERNKSLERRRNRTNAITLTGQSISFAVQYVYAVSHWYLVLRKNSRWDFVSFYYSMVYGVSAWTLITWSQILASTEMRKCLFAFFE